MRTLITCAAALTLILAPAALAESPAPLKLSPGYYEGYNERYFDYKALKIGEDGQHVLVDSHLSWGLSAAYQTTFDDEAIRCSHVECVIDITEPDHEDLLSRLVLSPSVGDGWHVMQTSVKPDGEFVATQTFVLNASAERADVSLFKSHYANKFANLTRPSYQDLDGLWIGFRNNDTRTSLVAMEFKHGEPTILRTFGRGRVNEFAFAASDIQLYGQSLTMTTHIGTMENNLHLQNQLGGT